MPQSFMGVTVIQPQAFVVPDDSAMESGNNINDVAIGVVGVADGGAPNTPLEFTTARAARKTLVGGPLADAIDRAYNPGVQPGAYRVIAVRLDGDPAVNGNPALRASIDLMDGAAAAVHLLAAQYGNSGNQIAVEVADPTTPGQGKNLFVYGPNAEIEGVNVGAAALSVLYTGTAATATVTVTATQLATTVTGTPADAVTIDFVAAPTLQDVVSRLNATGKYTAAVVGVNPSAPSASLDQVATASVKTTALTLRADLQAQIDWLNDHAGDLVVASKAQTATGTLVNLPRTYLASGRDPVITTNSWANALDVLSGVEVQIVCALTGDPTIHAMVAGHVAEMSLPEQKRERRAIVGGPLGETPTQAKAAAAALNSDRVQRVYPGIKDEAGNLVAPYVVAMQKAGISAGLQPGYAATKKFLRASGVERTLDEGTVNDLEQSGLMVVKPIIGRGITIVHDQMTWLRDNRVDRREFATGQTLDRVYKRIRDVAEARVGEPSTPATRQILLGDISAALTAMTTEGMLVGDGPNPPFRHLTIRTVGLVAEISVEVSVGGPLNYIAIAVKASVYGGSSS